MIERIFECYGVSHYAPKSFLSIHMLLDTNTDCRLSLMRTHMQMLLYSLTFLCGIELARFTLQLQDGPVLLTVRRPHDFIFGTVRDGPHYVSARLNGLFVLAWLWSSSAWSCAGPTVPLRLKGVGWGE